MGPTGEGTRWATSSGRTTGGAGRGLGEGAAAGGGGEEEDDPHPLKGRDVPGRGGEAHGVAGSVIKAVAQVSEGALDGADAQEEQRRVGKPPGLQPSRGEPCGRAAEKVERDPAKVEEG